MKALLWIIAGIGFGAALTYIVLNQPRSAVAIGYDAVEGAARDTLGGVQNNRRKGREQSVLGAVKEGVGRVAGDNDLADEGAAERLVGNAKDAAGNLGLVVGETSHDLNV